MRHSAGEVRVGFRFFVAVLFVGALGCGGCDDSSDPKLGENSGSPDMAANSSTADGGNRGDGGTVGDTSAPGDGGSTEDGGANNTNNQVFSEDGQLDLLVVLDNSGSACSLQSRLRNGFRALLGPLTDAEVDVRIALTTTHMKADYVLEPVAVPGQIQATPQPVPGFDRTCIEDANGFGPLRDALEAALACSNVDPANYQWTDADIECAMYGQPQGCTLSNGTCRTCTAENLFPPADSYEQLPKVLAVEQYRDATGKLDFTRLERDFACMSLAGTRGYGIEKGLAAAALATSPGLVGGSVETPTDASAPNHGLLRDEAHFGLVFMTDENDCSDDGTLAEDSACGGYVCEFANIEGDANSPLLSVASVKAEVMANLRVVKGDDFDERRVWLGGIHGPWDRFTGPVPTEAECGNYPGIPRACEMPNGAFSGDRYDRFLGEFPESNVYPVRGSDGHLPGLACEADLETHLRSLGDAMATGAR